MIDITKLKWPEDVGRWVEYDNGFRPVERGRIKNWSSNTIFVVFECGDDWFNFDKYTGAGCPPEALDFMPGECGARQNRPTDAKGKSKNADVSMSMFKLVVPMLIVGLFGMLLGFFFAYTIRTPCP